MDFNLTYHFQHSKRCRDGKLRTFILYFINGRLALKHKNPYDDTIDKGYDHITHIFDIYYLDGSIYQKRQLPDKWDGELKCRIPQKIREVKFPISRNLLKELNIPKNFKMIGVKGI